MGNPSDNSTLLGLAQVTQDESKQVLPDPRDVGTHLHEDANKDGGAEISLSPGNQDQTYRRSRQKPIYLVSSSELQVPHLTQTDTATTDGGEPPECDDGGRNYEINFLQERINQQRASRDPLQPQSQHLSRTYEKSKVTSVKNTLTKKGTMMIGAMNAKEKFISCSSLYEIMSPKTVHMLLDEIFPGRSSLPFDEVHHISPTDFKQPGLRRIFALLIIIGRQNDILDLIDFDNDMNDSYLPALDEHSSSTFKEQPTLQEKRLEEFFARQQWSDDDMSNFRSRQWEVLPVFFANQGPYVLHYKCRSGEILPLIQHENAIEKQGGFGEVTSYMLHEDQQSLERYTARGAQHPIVVKKFKEHVNRQEFYRESSVLRRLTRSSRGKSQHLAKLLATFEIPKGPNSTARDYYMMFECADMTLDDLFRQKPSEISHRFSMNESSLHEWVAVQAFGLARALHAIHHFKRGADDLNDATHGIHGDLKPQNILLYHDWDRSDGREDENQDSGRPSDRLGVLQITDFGRSSFHHTLTIEDIKFASLGGDYCPPELQLRLPVSASLDIWTLACLYLDMVTWLLKGPQGVEKFRDERDTPGFLMELHRCFYTVKKEKKRTLIFVSDAVLKWSTDLYGSQNGSEFTRDLLKLILDHMLVIEDKNSPDFQNREMSPHRKRDLLKLNVFKGRHRQRNDSIAEGRSVGSYATLSNSSDIPHERQEFVSRSRRIGTGDLVGELKRLRAQGQGIYQVSLPRENYDFRKSPRNALHSPSAFAKLYDKRMQDDAGLSE